MSPQVLTQYLLDFGKSYWGSDLMIEEFPGLLASGLDQTGKFGIGFLSIFMLGSAVRVATKRYQSGQSDTIILEFNTGVSSKPIIRPAEKNEQIRDGGSYVRVWLDLPFEETILKKFGFYAPTLEGIIKDICPSIDVNVEFQDNSEHQVNLIISNKWMEEKGPEFLRRFINNSKENRNLETDNFWFAHDYGGFADSTSSRV